MHTCACFPFPSARGAATDRSGEPAALALQRLGHACGQSAMCADLAAFVALKQAHCAGDSSQRSGGDSGNAGEALLYSGSDADSPVSLASSGAGSNTGAADGAATQATGGKRRADGSSTAVPASWQRLAPQLQAKLLLLTCLEHVAGVYAAARVPPPLTPVNLLVSELLVPAEEMQRLCAVPQQRRRGSGGGAAAGGEAAWGVAQLRQLSMRVIAAFGRLPGRVLRAAEAAAGAGASQGAKPDASAGGGAGRRGSDDTVALDVRPKQHDDVVAQLRQRLGRVLGHDKDTLRGEVATKGHVIEHACLIGACTRQVAAGSSLPGAGGSVAHCVPCAAATRPQSPRHCLQPATRWWCCTRTCAPWARPRWWMPSRWRSASPWRGWSMVSAPCRSAGAKHSAKGALEWKCRLLYLLLKRMKSRCKSMPL